MVKIENNHDYDIELHWFSLTTEGVWEFSCKEIIKPGSCKERYVSEFYYFKMVKA